MTNYLWREPWGRHHLPTVWWRETVTACQQRLDAVHRPARSRDLRLESAHWSDSLYTMKQTQTLFNSLHGIKHSQTLIKYYNKRLPKLFLQLLALIFNFWHSYCPLSSAHFWNSCTKNALKVGLSYRPYITSIVTFLDLRTLCNKSWERRWHQFWAGCTLNELERQQQNSRGKSCPLNSRGKGWPLN